MCAPVAREACRHLVSAHSPAIHGFANAAAIYSAPDDALSIDASYGRPAPIPFHASRILLSAALARLGPDISAAAWAVISARADGMKFAILVVKSGFDVPRLAEIISRVRFRRGFRLPEE
jgi:hypothetical protein